MFMKEFFLSPKKKGLLVVAFLLFFLLSPYKQLLADEEEQKGRPIPGKLLILPFQNMTDLYGIDSNVRCPICGKVYITGEVPDRAPSYLSSKLISILKEKKYYKKIVTSSSQWGNADLMAKKNRDLTERELLMAAGLSAGADTVMAGYLYRYRQRVGTNISVDTPASVAFGIHLIDVKTGRSLWKGHIDETQRSLSENLFNIDTFIKRKARWVTAEEMAISGLEEILKTLPKK